MKRSLHAILLFRIFIGVFILMIGVLGGGIYFAGQQLQAKAIETDHARIDAELIQNEIGRLKNLQEYLSKNKTSIERAESIVAESKEYKYQNQVISDINAFANQTGITILGFDFVSENTSAPQPSTTGAPATGLKKTVVTLTIQEKTGYENLVRFIKSIEQNLTKMQLTSISLAPDITDPRSVSNPTINLEVYIN